MGRSHEFVRHLDLWAVNSSARKAVAFLLDSALSCFLQMCGEQRMAAFYMAYHDWEVLVLIATLNGA